MTTVAQPLFQRIQGLNDSVLAGVDAGVVASHAVSVIQALPLGAVTWQFGGVSARYQQDPCTPAKMAFLLFPPISCADGDTPPSASGYQPGRHILDQHSKGR